MSGWRSNRRKTLDVPLPATALTEQMLRATIAKGWGDDDFCSAIRVLEEWAGIEVKEVSWDRP